MKKCYGCGQVLPDGHDVCDLGLHPLCAECYESYHDFVSDEAAEGAREERQWAQNRYDMEITEDGYPPPSSLD
jgi:hypothetical protein